MALGPHFICPGPGHRPQDTSVRQQMDTRDLIEIASINVTHVRGQFEPSGACTYDCGQIPWSTRQICLGHPTNPGIIHFHLVNCKPDHARNENKQRSCAPAPQYLCTDEFEDESQGLAQPEYTRTQKCSDPFLKRNLYCIQGVCGHLFMSLMKRQFF